MAPRLQQVRVIELLSTAPVGLLWLAEKGVSRARVLVAEYEPKGGGKSVLREFNSWCQRLKGISAEIVPVLDTRYAHEDRLFLVLDVPPGQSVQKVLDVGLVPVSAPELLRRLLGLVGRFSDSLPGSSHGWVRSETVTIQSDGRVLLGPPAFLPGELANPQGDLRDCAAITAQWARIPLRELDADAEQRNQLQKVEDWALAATLEWILFCKDRAPQSASAAIGFLDEALAVRSSKDGANLAGPLASLKNLYQRSGSSIIKREIEKVEERLAAGPKTSQPQPESPAKTEPSPKPAPNVIPEPKAEPVAAPPAPPPPQPAPAVEPEPSEPVPTIEQIPKPPPPTPPRKQKWVWVGLLALVAIFGIYYYVSNAPLRELSDYLDKRMLVNTNGPSAYAVYQKALREKGPESGLVKSMNEKALPVLQQVSKEAFDSWYKESELSKPPERRAPGETAIASWDEMLQMQEWLANVQRSPLSSAQYAYARGMVALSRRNWNDARQQFEEALRNQQNWSLALNGVGKSYFGLRQYDMTEKYYRLASEADPSWYFPHSNLGTLYRDVLKNFEAAEREYRAAIQLDPGRPSFHFNLGLLYYMYGKQYWPSACSEFNSALNPPSGRSLAPSEANTATQRRQKVCQSQ